MARVRRPAWIETFFRFSCTLPVLGALRNHEMIRDAIAQSGIARDELFLTSKVGLFPSSMELPQDPASWKPLRFGTAWHLAFASKTELSRNIEMPSVLIRWLYLKVLFGAAWQTRSKLMACR